MKSFKRVGFLLLFLTIFSFTIPTTHATDLSGLNYSLLKNEYINNHPNQAIILYPWDTSTSIKILPFNYEIPAIPANNFSITACRNQFESASFVINAQKNISGIEIIVPDLYNANGNQIPANAVNPRLVKVWYQAGDGEILWYNKPKSVLTPELLLKDDSLVKVDYITKTNYLKVNINGVEQYIDISNSTGIFPKDAKIFDSQSLQPFSLQMNENKQIWLTVHIPSNIPAGEYYGDIKITTLSELPVILNFSVTVLPFDLEPSPVEYSLYYRGVLSSNKNLGINSEWKNAKQYSLELQNMKEHGISYPTLYQPDDQMLETALLLRNQSGLPVDHIYSAGIFTGNLSTWHMLPDPLTQDADLAKLANRVKNYKNKTTYYGFGDLYIYGFDEYSGDLLRSERPAWQQVHKSEAKVFVSCNNDAVDIVGDLLDVANLWGPLNATQVSKWHSYGKKVFSYANPQVGVEDPEIYRKNYGFLLWNAGYDGTMSYAYQHSYGHIWNDFDFPNWRDHVFAYPTSSGVIDTIQWEGWRKGVDDTRYLATLLKKEGSDTSARAIISDSLSKGKDMAAIRKKVIDQILTSRINPAPALSAAQTQIVGTGFLTIIADVQAIFSPHTVTQQSNCTPYYCQKSSFDAS